MTGLTISGRARPEWLVVALVFGTIVLAIGAWVALDRRPPEWDHASHLERSVLCARDLVRGNVSAIFQRSTFYPPLVTCAAGVAYLVAPSDVAAGQAVILAFLGMGMAATFLLSRRMAGDRGGTVAALVFGTAPFTIWQALRFQLDLPLAAMVALALVLLLWTEDFTRLGWSLVAGVVLGLGLLTKPPFAAYVLPLVLVILGRARGAGLANAALSAAVAGLVSLPWYGPRLLGMAHQVSSRSFRQAAEQGHPDPLSVAGLTYYPLHFGEQIGLLGAVLFMAGLVIAIRRRLWFPLAALSPLIVFFLIQNKNLRYTEPLLPAAAVVSGLGFIALPSRLQPLGMVALVMAGLLQLSSATFGIPSAARLAFAGVPLAMQSPPVRDDWHHREILAAVVKDSRGTRATVSVVPNHPFFSASNFRYYGVRDRLPVAIARAWDDEPLGVEYMILKTGDVGPTFTAEKPRRIAERLTVGSSLARVFPVIGQWPLPDGSVATLRARRLPAGEGPPDALARTIEAAFVRRLPEIARDVSDLRVRAHYDASEILTGRIRRVEISAAAATVAEFKRPGAAELRLHDVRVMLDDVVVNPLSARSEGRLEPLDIGRLRIERMRIPADALPSFLNGLKDFKGTTLTLEEGWIRFVRRQRGPDVAARVRIEPSDGRPFALAARDVKLGGLPVPRPLVDWVMRSYDPGLGLARRAPMPVEIGSVTITPRAIVIGPRSG